MQISLQPLNQEILKDPTGLIARCDQYYNDCVAKAAEAAIANRHNSPIILLTGPSSAGKTTTAGRLQKRLQEAGYGCKMVSMDDYYRDCDHSQYPQTPDGQPDLESPYALDTEMLNDHFSKLEAGESVLIPHFDFTTRTRDFSARMPLKLESGEFVIFEGLHALNPMFTETHPGAYRIFICPESDVVDGTEIVFYHTWTRLMRRCIRDLFHRNASVAVTLSMWENVRRGENLYIQPYISQANFRINTLHAYEIPVLAHYMEQHIAQLSPSTPQYETVMAIKEGLRKFAPLDPALVPETSLLKEEFI